jgi:hypothetical protein
MAKRGSEKEEHTVMSHQVGAGAGCTEMQFPDAAERMMELGAKSKGRMRPAVTSRPKLIEQGPCQEVQVEEAQEAAQLSQDETWEVVVVAAEEAHALHSSVSWEYRKEAVRKRGTWEFLGCRLVADRMEKQG